MYLITKLHSCEMFHHLHELKYLYDFRIQVCFRFDFFINFQGVQQAAQKALSSCKAVASEAEADCNRQSTDELNHIQGQCQSTGLG